MPITGSIRLLEKFREAHSSRILFRDGACESLVYMHLTERLNRDRARNDREFAYGDDLPFTL
jgi:hypothetical protein